MSLFDNTHFVEIGTASLSSYTDSFINCRNYLRRVLDYDSKAVHMAITQNHLPYTQRFYRHLCRNGYNLGMLSIENPESCLELRVVILARSNYAPWVRNDRTGYEVMLGDMATFSAPEKTAESARAFW